MSSKSTTATLAILICALCTLDVRAGATVNLTDVNIGGSINPIAAHGAFTDPGIGVIGSDGNPLNTLLNGGGSLSDRTLAFEDGDPLIADENGLFVDVSGGATGSSALPAGLTWTFLGKDEQGDTGNVFSNSPYGSTSGVLNLADPSQVANKVFALYLKDGESGWGVYAFNAMPSVTSINFTMAAFLNEKGQQQALSNAALFVSNSGPIPPNPQQGAVPEPGSMIVWGLGLGFAAVFGYRRRRAKATAA